MLHAITYFHSPIGWLRMQGSESGLSNIDFVDAAASDEQYSELLTEAILQLTAYFEGTRKKFELTLNPKGTEFQQKVWRLLQEIEYGKTTHYESVAHSFGNVRAIRAVANANAQNPIPIIIPCHRVIGKDGKLTGYSGGLWRKQWLLHFENPDGQMVLW